MPATLGDDTSVQLYAASGFRWLRLRIRVPFLEERGRLLGVCHVVYWPVCVSPVHIWIFVAILMNFQGDWSGSCGSGRKVRHVRPHDMDVQDATMSVGSTGCSALYGGLGLQNVSGVIVWAVIMAILVRDDALGYLVIWANQAIYSQLSSTLQLCGNRYALLF